MTGQILTTFCRIDEIRTGTADGIQITYKVTVQHNHGTAEIHLDPSYNINRALAEAKRACHHWRIAEDIIIGQSAQETWQEYNDENYKPAF